MLQRARKSTSLSRRLLSGTLTVFGFAIFGFVGISLISHPGQFSLTYLLQVFALPIWLTLASLPFIYLVGLYAGYQQVFLRLQLREPDPEALRRAKVALVLACHVRATRIGGVSWRNQHELLEASSLGEARRVLRRGTEEPSLEVLEVGVDDEHTDAEAA